MAETLTIAFVSHTDTSGTFRVGSHHLARELARFGHRVLHLSTPVSLVHRVLRRGEPTRDEASRRGIVTDADGVMHLVPRTLLPAGIGPLSFAPIFTRAFGTSSIDLVFVDQPTLWSNELRRLATTVVYRPTDLYEHGVKARFQRAAVAAADRVVATSGAVLTALGVPASTPSLVLPNGVELERFILTEDDVREDRAVYIGALDDRFDWNAVREMALRLPEWTFDIFGPGQAAPEPLPANVLLRGPVSYDDIPLILRRARIGLLPLSDAPVNRGRSPMKLYEYLASGLAVVTRETDVLTDDPDTGVVSYGRSRSAADAIQVATASASPNLPGSAAAAAAGWSEKARTLLGFATGGAA
ncbi:glycosyltransferase [Plantibacter sp. VKM Ac-2876]|uniref:glycosyltransferase family protein n=1 Tax=Plantibacter sp. VKM Ac-2876 TaxID=2783826 RepID=UPI00188B62E3|nr:glycosyltransferase [Plantibacter sp. VKM Ac-2876]MBF4566499.1 glycosyltransferase [Plantibacter sp. VKM Ac-2876]